MYTYSDGELNGEVCKCYRKEHPWFWYRDVLLQAEQRGIIRITKEKDGKPFWWMRFEDSVEVVSEKLQATLRDETNWGK